MADAEIGRSRLLAVPIMDRRDSGVQLFLAAAEAAEAAAEDAVGVEDVLGEVDVVSDIEDDL